MNKDWIPQKLCGSVCGYHLVLAVIILVSVRVVGIGMLALVAKETF